MNPAQPEGVWPTPLQEHLLKAALLSGPEAVRAWEAWIAEVDIDHLDGASFRMLPLLSANLQQLGITHPLLGRFKGTHRRMWYMNQRLFYQTAEAITLLEQAGIPTLVLKGAAWALLYYTDVGLRPMEDFDLLVPWAQALNAVKVLKAAGWGPSETPHIPFSVAMLNITHARGMVGPADQNVDLHWHIFHTDLEWEADKEFWEDTQPLDLNGAPARTLTATDHFLHICSLGIEWSETPPIRWVADAVHLLRATPELDWERFCSAVESHHLALQAQATLGYLTRVFAAPIPDAVMQRINGLMPSADDRRIFEAGLRPHDLMPVGYKIWYYARAYRRMMRDEGWLQKVWGIPGFFRDIWGVPGLWQVPGYAVQTTLARMRRIARRQKQS